MLGLAVVAAGLVAAVELAAPVGREELEGQGVRQERAELEGQGVQLSILVSAGPVAILVAPAVKALSGGSKLYI